MMRIIDGLIGCADEGSASNHEWMHRRSAKLTAKKTSPCVCCNPCPGSRQPSRRLPPI